MADTRKGFLTTEQEVKLDELIELKGVYEALDGGTIRLTDNILLEKLKGKIPAETLPVIYQVIDEVFNSLVTIAEK